VEFHQAAITGVVEIRPDRRFDDRGYFSEIFRVDEISRSIGTVQFVQENESLSLAAGTIRGLHFQSPPKAQAKLVRCTAGSLLDVAVDLRRGSPTYGRWVAVALSAKAGNQLWVPVGFAHGFCTLEPDTIVSYRVSAYYSPEHDKGVAWDDPEIGIAWPDIADADTLSAKDRVQPRLADLPAYFAMEDA
jgi:dTDP-4-dehydrorhamnose 3,5-epimerase